MFLAMLLLGNFDYSIGRFRVIREDGHEDDDSPLSRRVEFNAEKVRGILGQSKGNEAGGGVECELCYENVDSTDLIRHQCGGSIVGKKSICRTCLLGAFQACHTACSSQGFWKHVVDSKERLPCPFCKQNIIEEVPEAQEEFDRALAHYNELQVQRTIMDGCYRFMIQVRDDDKLETTRLFRQYNEEGDEFKRIRMRYKQLESDEALASILGDVRIQFLRASALVATYYRDIGCYETTVSDYSLEFKVDRGDSLRTTSPHIFQHPFSSLSEANIFLRVGKSTRDEHLRRGFEAVRRKIDEDLARTEAEAKAALALQGPASTHPVGLMAATTDSTVGGSPLKRARETSNDDTPQPALKAGKHESSAAVHEDLKTESSGTDANGVQNESTEVETSDDDNGEDGIALRLPLLLWPFGSS